MKSVIHITIKSGPDTYNLIYETQAIEGILPKDYMFGWKGKALEIKGAAYAIDKHTMHYYLGEYVQGQLVTQELLDNGWREYNEATE
jgi:hypothetical protein